MTHVNLKLSRKDSASLKKLKAALSKIRDEIDVIEGAQTLLQEEALIGKCFITEHTGTENKLLANGNWRSKRIKWNVFCCITGLVDGSLVSTQFESQPSGDFYLHAKRHVNHWEFDRDDTGWRPISAPEFSVALHQHAARLNNIGRDVALK